MRVGFIGLGTMGSRMAGNVLAAGHPLVVHDIDPATGEDLLDQGAVWAVSPAAVAGQVDVVFTSLPGPAQVEAVALSVNGIIGGALPGLAYFDLSTNSPTVMRRIHAELSPRGIHVFDAPVSGGPDGAASGKLAIWAGGDPEAFEAFLPVLRSFSDAPHLVGPVGAGSVAKLVHNASGYIIQTALAETFTLGVKAGVEPEALWEAVRMGALGRRRTFDTLARNFLSGRFDPPDFALELARKDVSLACELAREYDVPMRLANLTLQEMTEAMNRGWARRDSRSVMLLQEERSGVEVRVTPERIAEIIDGDSHQPDPEAEAEASQSWFDRTVGRMRGRNRNILPATESSPSATATVRQPATGQFPAVEAREQVKPPSILDQQTAASPADQAKPPSLLDDHGLPATGTTQYLAPGHLPVPTEVKPPSILDDTFDPPADQPPAASGPGAPSLAEGVPAVEDAIDHLLPVTPVAPVVAAPSIPDGTNAPDGGVPVSGDALAPNAAPSAGDGTAQELAMAAGDSDKPPSLLDELLDELLEDGSTPGFPIVGGTDLNGNGQHPTGVVTAATVTAPLTPASGGTSTPDATSVSPTMGAAPAIANGAVVVAEPPQSHAPTQGHGSTEAAAPKTGWWYGWTVVSTVFVILMVTSGLGFYNASVILKQAAIELGISLGLSSAGAATFFGISGIAGFVLAGRMEKVDLRWFYVAGGVLGSAALFSLRWVHSVAALFAFFAVFGVGFALCGLVPSTTVVTRWFHAKRSVAISVATSGLSLGGIVLTPVASKLIREQELAGAGPKMALIWIVGVVPLALLLIRSRPSEKGVGADGVPLAVVAAGETPVHVPLAGASFVDARRTRFFVMMCVAYALVFFSQVGGLAHLYGVGVDRVDATTGSLALSLLALTSVGGRLLGGLIVLRVPPKLFSMILVVLQAVALIAISVSNTRMTLLASAIFLGVSVGNLLMLQPLLLAEAFGVASFSRIYGLNQLISTIGVAGGPVILGFVHDSSSYGTAFVVAGLGSVLGFVALVIAGSTDKALALWNEHEPAPATAPANSPPRPALAVD